MQQVENGSGASAGQWHTTRVAFAESEIRREHPEARRFQGRMILIDQPESETEVSAQRPARVTDPNHVVTSTATCDEANVDTGASIRDEAEALLALGGRPSPKSRARCTRLNLTCREP